MAEEWSGKHDTKEQLHRRESEAHIRCPQEESIAQVEKKRCLQPQRFVNIKGLASASSLELQSTYLCQSELYFSSHLPQQICGQVECYRR